VEFRVLGPLEVRAEGRVLDLGGLRQRRVLAALLLRPNRVVSMARLTAAAWDGEPPATAGRQVRNRVAALRANLTRFGGFIDTEESGYVLRVGPGELDVAVFDELVARGRAAGDAAVLREALALWRGPALADLGGTVLAGEAATLEERRVAAVEDCVELELAAGRHADLVAELRGLVAAHPLRERLVGHLMTALHRCGRQPEALAVYRELADRLADELGIDPSPALRRLHGALRGGAGTAADKPAGQPTGPAAGEVPPRQLPAEGGCFTGRAADLARLDGMLSSGPADTAIVISAIVGTAGVGKTALALHWAHRIRDRFPDGQLYVNLRGYSLAEPVRPIDALGGFLRALGVPGERIPVELAEAAALYRSVLADRRVLVLLDNAASAEQVRPLLPAGAGCLALITSRDALAGLVAVDGARRVTLDVLPDGEARGLLASVLGPERVAAEPAAVAELARLCAYLPLALRIAAANLGERESLAAYADRLATGNRLAALQVDGDQRAAVRAAFELSYEGMGEPARRMFRLVGLAPGPDVAVAAAGALAGTTPEEARRLLDRLTAAHLLEAPAAGRYAFHDLLRVYAAELVYAADDPRAALHRVLDHYVHAAHTAARLLAPYRDPIAVDPAQPAVPTVHLTDAGQAMAWFVAEHQVLVAAVEKAADAGSDDHAWHLAWALTDYFDRQGHWHDHAAAQDSALNAARRTADPRRQAYSHRALAAALIQLGRHADAYAQLGAALDLFRQLGDGPGQAHVHRTLAWLDERQGRAADALAHAEHALELFGAAGHRAGQARALNAVGWYHAQLGDYQQALAHCEQALVLLREIGDRDGQAGTWDSLGYARHHLGHHREATACYDEALRLYRELGDRYLEADTLAHLGDAYLAAGAPDAARTSWQDAVEILDQLGHTDAEQVRARLAS